MNDTEIIGNAMEKRRKSEELIRTAKETKSIVVEGTGIEQIRAATERI